MSPLISHCLEFDLLPNNINCLKVNLSLSISLSPISPLPSSSFVIPNWRPAFCRFVSFGDRQRTQDACSERLRFWGDTINLNSELAAHKNFKMCGSSRRDRDNNNNNKQHAGECATCNKFPFPFPFATTPAILRHLTQQKVQINVSVGRGARRRIRGEGVTAAGAD